MKRPGKRIVSVDLGYDLAEHWVLAIVVRSQTCRELFTDGENEQLLVEIPGGERIWVAFWREPDAEDGARKSNQTKKETLKV